MNKDNLNHLKSCFNNYVKSFYDKNPLIQKNIVLKEKHTKRVCDNALLISNSLDLKDNNKYLAEAIALLHDIGRFEQFKKYKTFDDRISENHALLGVKVIQSLNLLEFLSLEDQTVILKAVEHHNMYKLPSNLTKDVILHSNIIRDSDKLDILKVVTDYYSQLATNPNPAIEHNLPDTDEYSKYIIYDIFNNRCSSNKSLKTCNDMRLIKLTWIFDINFPITMKLIKERRYIEKSLEVLPKNQEMQKVYDYLMDYINKIIS